MGKNYKGYLVDLDGTMYRGEEEIPAAGRFIQRLRDNNIPFLFVTNNSTAQQADVAKKLNRLNVEAHEGEIYTSSLAAADYITHQGGKTVYVIGEDGLIDAVNKAGITITDDQPEYVLVGLDRELTYEKVEKATLAIRAGAKFIITNPDTNLPTEKGFVPGTGSIAALLSKATRQEPLIIGKPESIIMNEALKEIGFSKDEVLMVGDNYETDITAGIKNNIDTLIVYSGFSTKEEVAEMKDQPTYSVDSLDDWEI